MPDMTRAMLEGMIKDIVGTSLEDIHKRIEEQRKEHLEHNKGFFEFVSQAQRAKDEKVHPRLRKSFAGSYMRALLHARKHGTDVIDNLRKWDKGDLVKALGEDQIATGGALVPQTIADEIVGLLYAQTVVRRLGAMTVPMPNGSLSIPYVATGASANYVGENQNITKSEETTGMLDLQARKLAVIVPVSNELLDDSSGAADAMIQTDIVNAAKVREDLAFIRGDGTANTPKGQRNWAIAANVFATAGTSLANKITDLSTAMGKLEDLDIPLLKPAWMLNPRTKRNIMFQVDSNGNFVFKEEMARGELLGFPFAFTTSIPKNLSGTETEIYFTDYASQMIGETMDMKVEVFDGAAYYDGSAMQSGVSRDQSVIRLLMRHDYGSRYRGQDIAVVTAVAY